MDHFKDLNLINYMNYIKFSLKFERRINLRELTINFMCEFPKFKGNRFPPEWYQTYTVAPKGQRTFPNCTEHYERHCKYGTRMCTNALFSKSYGAQGTNDATWGEKN